MLAWGRPSGRAALAKCDASVNGTARSAIFHKLGGAMAASARLGGVLNGAGSHRELLHKLHIQLDPVLGRAASHDDPHVLLAHATRGHAPSDLEGSMVLDVV